VREAVFDATRLWPAPFTGIWSSVPSTNEVAKKVALDAGAVRLAGSVVIAETQTEGKGRFGRTWVSPPGGLYLSVLVEPPAGPGEPLADPLTMLPLAAGVAVAQAVRRVAGVPAELRWPNDLDWEGRKVAGVLAEVGGGAWQPQRDARPWVRFALTAHYRQARTLLRRADEAERRWDMLERETRRRRLPARFFGALRAAAQGFRVRNATYRDFAEISVVVAGRDLKALSDTGLLVAQGQARGRYYVASEALKALELSIRRDRPPIPDPFDEDLRQQELPLGRGHRPG